MRQNNLDAAQRLLDDIAKELRLTSIDVDLVQGMNNKSEATFRNTADAIIEFADNIKTKAHDVKDIVEIEVSSVELEGL